eukprot:364812-Chlamydomonas_euryale.AAC.2
MDAHANLRCASREEVRALRTLLRMHGRMRMQLHAHARAWALAWAHAWSHAWPCAWAPAWVRSTCLLVPTPIVPSTSRLSSPTNSGRGLPLPPPLPLPPSIWGGEGLALPLALATGSTTPSGVEPRPRSARATRLQSEAAGSHSSACDACLTRACGCSAPFRVPSWEAGKPGRQLPLTDGGSSRERGVAQGGKGAPGSGTPRLAPAVAADGSSDRSHDAAHGARRWQRPQGGMFAEHKSADAGAPTPRTNTHLMIACKRHWRQYPACGGGGGGGMLVGVVR